MKSIFPLLLIYVFMTSQTFALSGGPRFGNGTVLVSGLYSGVLEGVTETNSATQGPPIPGDPVTDPNATGTPSNAIGLFSLTVPNVGLATGTFLLFANGRVFTGTIDASGDPDSGEIKGILQGTFNFSLSNGTESVAVTASAVGRIDALVRANQGLFAISLARLEGTADLGINFGLVDPATLEPVIDRTITFDVVGFKQAEITQ
jgi:hypothetical protein